MPTLYAKYILCKILVSDSVLRKDFFQPEHILIQADQTPILLLDESNFTSVVAILFQEYQHHNLHSCLPTILDWFLFLCTYLAVFHLLVVQIKVVAL